MTSQNFKTSKAPISSAMFPLDSDTLSKGNRSSDKMDKMGKTSKFVKPTSKKSTSKKMKKRSRGRY